jgi:ABC-2 type transport system permease protein
MWYPPFLFALRQQLRRPFLRVMAAGLALGSACLIAALRSEWLELFGATTASAPRIIAVVLAGVSAFSLLLMASPLADLVLRDFQTGMAQLVFTSPLKPRQYLAGRLLAGLLTYLAVMGAASLGVLAGLAFADDLHLKSAAVTLLWAFGCLLLPNACFIVAAIVALASRVRTLGAVYAGVLSFYVLWGLAPLISLSDGNPLQKLLAALLDPFGSRVLSAMPALAGGSIDSQLPSLSGAFLFNRVLWLLISTGLAAWALSSFRVSRLPSARSSAEKLAEAPGAPLQPVAPDLQDHSAFALAPLRALVAIGFRWIILGTTFRVVLGLTVLLTLGLIYQSSGLYDTQSEITTAWALQALTEGLRLPLTFLLAVFAGGLVFRARESRIDGIESSLPVSRTSRIVADDLILIALIILIHAALLTVVLSIECLSGGRLEPAPLAQWLLRSILSFTILALLARALFGLFPHRAIGFSLFATLAILAQLGAMRHPEYQWLALGTLPAVGYSDLAGFFISNATWLNITLTWGAVVIALQVVGSLRSQVKSAMSAMPRAILAITRQPWAVLCVLVSLAGALSGASSLYRESTSNIARNSTTMSSARASRYERAYGKYVAAPQLRVRSVRAEVDFYPSEGRATLRGTYTLLNTDVTAIDTLYLNLDARDDVQLSLLQPYLTTLDDTELGFRIVKLSHAVAPGETLELSFTARIEGSTHDPTGAAAPITKSGAMFTNQEHFPQFGYLHRKAATSAARVDAANSQLEGQADFIDFSAVVSTDADQTALAPGVLEREWRTGNRHYGRYRMPCKMLPYFAFASGHYEIARDIAGVVPVEVFYDARHARNVPQALKTAKDSLTLYSQQFGAYPFGILRLVEVQGTVDAAESFPSLVVFTESSEFTRNLEEGKRHSMQFMLAHEVAHQWFAHQMIGADAPGANVLTETIAQYLALTELERTAGRAIALKAVQADLDAYLKLRPHDAAQERALSAETGQAYLYYHKGAVAFWLLGQNLSEPVLSSVLASFLTDYRLKNAPYPTVADLESRLRARANEAQQAQLNTLFNGTAVPNLASAFVTASP